MTLRLGTRASKLALAQTALVSERLRLAHPGLTCEVVSMATRGDEVLDRPLPEFGRKGVFTDRIEAALRGGEIDAAVHSLKDLPVEEPAGLAIGAVLGRDEVRDAVVARDGCSLAALRPGAIVGTSSTRRRAQLLAARPDLAVTSIRGNVETRVRRVDEGEYDATLLAAAGLGRLSLLGRASELLSLETMLPAPGQGALAVQCRSADSATLGLLRAIDEPELRRSTDAERGFLRELGGGCSAPIAAYAQAVAGSGAGAARAAAGARGGEPGGAGGSAGATGGEPGGAGGSAGATGGAARAAGGASSAPGGVGAGALRLTARVVSPDGKRVIEVKGEGVDPRELAARLAREALALGAARILAERAPLFGRTVVVTRPVEQGAELADRLSALGATPVVVPLIRIEAEPDSAPIDAAIESLDRYRWVLFTSANGVRHFCDRIEAVRPRAGGHHAGGRGAGSTDRGGAARRAKRGAGSTDRGGSAAQGSAALGAAAPGAAARALRGRVAAVGEATARELEARGVAVELVPTAANGAALARAVIERDGRALRGSRVLLPRAREGGEEIVETLRAAGALVDELAVYRTIAVSPDERELEPLRGRIDAVLLMSGSAARSLAALWPRVAALGAVREQGAFAVSSGARGADNPASGDAREAARRVPVGTPRPAIVCIGAPTRDAAAAAGLRVDVTAPSASSEAIAEALVEWFSGRNEE